MSFKLRSSVFSPAETIPARHTCDGDDVSPPLVWNEPPEGTRSLALDTLLDLPAGVDRDEFLEAAEGHVLAEATLTGHYQRQESAAAETR